MSSSTLLEKSTLTADPPTSSQHTQNIFWNVVSPLTSRYNRFQQWRIGLGLPSPGHVEELGKEAKMTHLTQFIFDGARADLTKGLSAKPAFQVTHSFALASQTTQPSYNFGTIFATDDFFMQANVDHDGTVNARSNLHWNKDGTNTTKFQGLFSHTVGQNMVQLEHEYAGVDYSLNVKAINPLPTDLTGVYVGKYLQSVTNKLSLGFETIYQRQMPHLTESTTSYLLKYTGIKRDWIATAQIQPTGMMESTYWQKLSEKLEVAGQLQMLLRPQQRNAMASFGAKYDLRMASFRAQLDSSGKVSALLEQRFAPAFAFQLAGEIDHLKNSAKVGVGVTIESTSLTPEEMGLPAVPSPYGSPYPGY